MLVHCRNRPDEPHRQTLTDAVPALTFGTPVPSPIDVLVCGRPTDEELAAIRPGGALVIPWAGLPVTTRAQALTRPDLAVYNLHHNARIVAEHAVGLLLAVTRRLLPADRALRDGDWRIRYAPDPSPGLAGQTAVILGYGAIGRRIGEALRAIGMTVVGIRRTGPPTLADLPSFLPRTAALFVALPATPKTEGLVDAALIAKLPPRAVIVNVGRGSVIDEAALYRALVEGRLFGAGLDVWWRYPDAKGRTSTPAATHPFHELDNVVLSPHRAAHGTEADRLRYTDLADVLRTLTQGGSPTTRVDVEEGY